jgi:hypothetical protein
VKAFIFSLLALAAITAAAATILQSMPLPSSEAYSEKPNVRL